MFHLSQGSQYSSRERVTKGRGQKGGSYKYTTTSQHSTDFSNLTNVWKLSFTPKFTFIFVNFQFSEAEHWNAESDLNIPIQG